MNLHGLATTVHGLLPGWRLRESAKRAWIRLPFTSPRARVAGFTLLPAARLKNLERSVQAMVKAGVRGDVVECGTAQGGSAALMALWLQRLGSDKRIYVCDTFEGLPAPTANDPDYGDAVKWTGQCRGELAQVRGLFEDLGVVDHAVFVKGLFQDTLPASGISAICLLHLDADWYDSTMTCLDNLWDRVAPGGILQIDDYGTWRGCRRAIDEFFERRGIRPNMVPIDGHACWFVKPETAGETK
jgi:predicted O-methyltransferase YrrM